MFRLLVVVVPSNLHEGFLRSHFPIEHFPETTTPLTPGWPGGRTRWLTNTQKFMVTRFIQHGRGVGRILLNGQVPRVDEDLKEKDHLHDMGTSTRDMTFFNFSGLYCIPSSFGLYPNTYKCEITVWGVLFPCWWFYMSWIWGVFSVSWQNDNYWCKLQFFRSLYWRFPEHFLKRGRHSNPTRPFLS